MESPRLVAMVAITVARADDVRGRAAASRSLEPVEIVANSVEDLQIRVSRYANDAVAAIGDPGVGRVGVAYDAAIATGTSASAAGSGVIRDQDATAA